MKYRSIVVFVVAAGLFGQLNVVPGMATERSVRDIQKALAEKGFKPGVPDGLWGKKSIAALRAYQSANGLPPTGSADSITIDRLFTPPPSSETQQPAATTEPQSKMPGLASPVIEVKPLEPIDDQASSPDKQSDQSKAVESTSKPNQAQSANPVGEKTSRTEGVQDTPSQPVATAVGRSILGSEQLLDARIPGPGRRRSDDLSKQA